MPPSKRNRVVPTSKTRKDRKALARRLHANIESAATSYASIWVFSVSNTRNNFVKDVRNHLSDSRIFMGKTKLMLHALGTSAETELLPGLSGLKTYMSGEVGLLFTDREPTEIEAYFDGLAQLDYARAGAVASSSFTIPRGGELTTKYGVEGGLDDPLPMAIEPTLRKLGVPTRIVKGKVMLAESGENEMDEDEEGYVVCREGDVLDSRQTAILKIFGARMAEFRIVLKAVYDKSNEQVRQIGEMEVD